MAQYIQIEQMWENANFYCPVCGKIVCKKGEFTETPCKHVLFSWIDQVGEFENLDPSLEALVESDDFFHPSDPDFLDKCPETAVLFAFEAKTMACGPVSCIVVHGIKFPE